MECTFKKSCINNLKVLFLFHRLLSNLLKKRIKNGGHQTNFLSGEQTLPLPHILLAHSFGINRGSYMSAHVVLNLFNDLWKRGKVRGLPSILSLFHNEFNKFNNTRARMLDSI